MSGELPHPISIDNNAPKPKSGPSPVKPPISYKTLYKPNSPALHLVVTSKAFIKMTNFRHKKARRKDRLSV
ncbi:hypothetical protein SHVI106290_06820 [Shewanella violacea]|uniref:Uncharacterized protein n=1 Tax=Shewanella violacea (strain JCM 10179 / CIP 106290 / LMG 19151 / DSS12) TaxID=637905 RepID=D4ZBG3_SHEVD|nr:hypothetical protein SVI_3387 [Shewanella violacea DSS12]